MCTHAMDCLSKWMSFVLRPTLKIQLGEKKSNEGMLLGYWYFNYVWKDKYSLIMMTKTFLDFFLIAN